MEDPKATLTDEGMVYDLDYKIDNDSTSACGSDIMHRSSCSLPKISRNYVSAQAKSWYRIMPETSRWTLCNGGSCHMSHVEGVFKARRTQAELIWAQVAVFIRGRRAETNPAVVPRKLACRDVSHATMSRAETNPVIVPRKLACRDALKCGDGEKHIITSECGE